MSRRRTPRLIANCQWEHTAPEDTSAALDNINHPQLFKWGNNLDDVMPDSDAETSEMTSCTMGHTVFEKRPACDFAK